MRDPFGREISYLRISVTDRCDFRCVYCMPERMTFLPRSELLTLEEVERLCAAFIHNGVTRLRITGGEPLVRQNVLWLFDRLGERLGNGLEELTLTTNGSQLARFAGDLQAAGVRRVNVSLDTLDAAKFRAITRRGELANVLAGIEAARRAGLAVKVNMVALREINEHEIFAMLEWSHRQGMDLTVIETMPLGEIEHRVEQYLPLSLVRSRLAERYTLEEIPYRTGGPARYFRVAETGGRLGFITPLTHGFCDGCNRVRVTCSGRLYLCLGRNDGMDLCEPLRASESDEPLHAAIAEAIGHKPKGHDFRIDRHRRAPAIARHMSLTGG